MDEFFAWVIGLVLLFTAAFVVELLFVDLDIVGGWFPNFVWMVLLGVGVGWGLSRWLLPDEFGLEIAVIALVVGGVLVWATDALLTAVFGTEVIKALFSLVGASEQRSIGASGVRLSLFTILSICAGLALSYVFLSRINPPRKNKPKNEG